MDLDTRSLRALEAAVRLGSLERAAAELSLTPSAVSQRVRALETAAGGVLLVRGRPVTVTERGARVLDTARRLDALLSDLGHALDATETRPHVSVGVSADSLATFVLPALAPLASEIDLRLTRADETRTADFLRDGGVMAAITGDPTPVHGCTVTALGVMRFRPYASSAFRERWWGGGEPEPFRRAPVVVFDEHDELQWRFLDRVAPGPRPPHHTVPSSEGFTESVRLGWGWGLVPDQHDTAGLELLGDEVLDVPLHLQRWSLPLVALDSVCSALERWARRRLDPPS